MKRKSPLPVLIAAATLVLANGGVASEGFQSRDDITRASHWIGATVATRDGRELGKVVDLAIDKHSGTMKYVVVSVGSFLIESSLIAVQPDALEPARDGGLTLIADDADLQSAKRFAKDQWPLQANLTRDDSEAAAAPSADLGAPPPKEAAGNQPTESGTATIADATKIAYLTGSERTIVESPAPTSPPAPPPSETKTPAEKKTKRDDKPETRFDRLDADGDGVLDRAEIAHEITYKDSYTELDLNANDVIDRDEFEALERRSSSQ